jgi:CubicO group peptidase (beta-lactamase class C family)
MMILRVLMKPISANQLRPLALQTSPSLTIVTILSCCIRNTGAQALDGAVRDLLNKNTPFRSYLVLQDGEIVAEWNSTAPAAFAAGKGGPFDYGYFQRMGLDVMDTTIGNVFSITKTFTGMLFGVMMEDPSVVLDLDETLGQIFIDAPEPGCSFDLSPEVAKDKKCNCLDPIATGCNLDWGSVPDAEKKKNITIKELLTMTSGLTSPKVTNIFNGEMGGANLLLSFADPFFDAPNTYPWHSVSGTYKYLSANNILSYVIWAKTGKTPKEYAESSKVLHPCCSACQFVFRAFAVFRC